MFQTKGATKKGDTLTYVLLCTFIPFAGSLIYPVLSLYVTTVLNFDSFKIYDFIIVFITATSHHT